MSEDEEQPEGGTSSADMPPLLGRERISKGRRRVRRRDHGLRRAGAVRIRHHRPRRRRANSDFVHVEDVVRANVAAMETDHVGESYNIGTGTSISIHELAELIQDITDTDADIVHTDPREGDIAASVHLWKRGGGPRV